MTKHQRTGLFWINVSWAVGSTALLALPFPSRAGAQDSRLATLIAAERAFASDAGKIGIDAAFRSHAAADAVLFRPDPAPAANVLTSGSDESGIRLEWQPAVAAMARSKDLGFTTGPYRLVVGGKARHGQYLTIWQRDGRGAWRWLLDHGLPPMAGDLTRPLPTTVTRLRPSFVGRPANGAGSAEEADANLNAELGRSGDEALSKFLSDDALVLRPGHEPFPSSAAVDRLPAPVTADRMFTRQSKAGDFAVSYGRVSAGAERRIGHYVRVWRLDRQGWRVLVDELVWRQP